MKNKSLVIFDLDGTLLDTAPGILESVAAVVDKLGLEKLPDDQMKLFVGPPVQDSFGRFYGMNEAEAQLAANLFRDYYKNKSLFKAQVYDGIFDILADLRRNGLRIAVATYKRQDYASLLLDKFGVSKYCDSIRGADNENKLKKSDIIRLCMNDIGVSCEACVLVGDTEHDASGADKVGIDFVGVGYGFGFKKQDDLERFCYKHYAHSVAELRCVLLE